MPFAKGALIDGTYRVLHVMHGGMASVYIAESVQDGRKYALKAPHVNSLSNPRIRRRFFVEAETWLNVGQHENIVQAVAFRILEGRPILFLEYVDAFALEVLMRARRPIHLSQAVDWADQIADGMGFLHSADIGPKNRRMVHRDLKPGNVLIDRDLRVKITDFGIVGIREGSYHMTEDGAFLGTPCYLAPEQIRTPSDVDHRADIYSFGAMLHEMVTGRPPFQGDSIPTILSKVIEEPLPDLPQDLGIPPSLSRLIEACLAKNPDLRPNSFEAVRERLQEVADFLREAPPSRDGYRRCGSCGVILPEDLDACLFKRGPAMGFETDPNAETTDLDAETREYRETMEPCGEEE